MTFEMTHITAFDPAAEPFAAQGYRVTYVESLPTGFEAPASVTQENPGTLSAVATMHRTAWLASRVLAYIKAASDRIIRALESELIRIVRGVKDRIQSLSRLQQNWDGYGAEPPNLRSRLAMYRVVDQAMALGLRPTRLVPSAEGGLYLSFGSKSVVADVESYNDGGLVFAYRTPGENLSTWEAQSESEDIKESILTLRAVLS